jgi:hypothetical protein
MYGELDIADRGEFLDSDSAAALQSEIEFVQAQRHTMAAPEKEIHCDSPGIMTIRSLADFHHGGEPGTGTNLAEPVIRVIPALAMTLVAGGKVFTCRLPNRKVALFRRVAKKAGYFLISAHRLQ